MLQAIDWSRPWYESVRDAAGRLSADGHFRHSFSAQAAALDLRNHQGLPLRFVPQEDLPDGTAYEEFIGATGGVPTRDNLHDFFNALGGRWRGRHHLGFYRRRRAVAVRCGRGVLPVRSPLIRIRC